MHISVHLLTGWLTEHIDLGLKYDPGIGVRFHPTNVDVASSSYIARFSAWTFSAASEDQAQESLAGGDASRGSAHLTVLPRRRARLGSSRE